MFDLRLFFCDCSNFIKVYIALKVFAEANVACWKFCQLRTPCERISTPYASASLLKREVQELHTLLLGVILVFLI